MSCVRVCNTQVCNLCGKTYHTAAVKSIWLFANRKYCRIHLSGFIYLHSLHRFRSPPANSNNNNSWFRFSWVKTSPDKLIEVESRLLNREWFHSLPLFIYNPPRHFRSQKSHMALFCSHLWWNGSTSHCARQKLWSFDWWHTQWWWLWGAPGVLPGGTNADGAGARFRLGNGVVV